MQIVEGSQNPTQWSYPSHPGSLWSLAILCGPLWCFPGLLWSPAVPCGVYSHPHFVATNLFVYACYKIQQRTNEYRS